MGAADLNARPAPRAPEAEPGALPRAPRSPVEAAGWSILALLLLATLALALSFDRAGRPSLVGDEATYAMAAASLAWDFDLAYSRADYDRFLAHWGGPPDGLILQSRDDGRSILYGKPLPYALAVAPFVRVAPVRGAVVANALFLAVASLLAAWSLRSRLGPPAPLWVAAFVFASVSFGYVFWVHADLFLFAATASGFALAYAGDRPRGSQVLGSLGSMYEDARTSPRARFLLRWAAAGLLLAIPGAYRPFYLALLLPAALAVPRERRRAGLAALLGGAVLLLGLTAAGQWASGGGWTGYGAERQGFYPRTGYPEVDFPASEWPASVRRWGNTSWTQEGAIDVRFDAGLAGWNALYFLAGRNVGVLPYFLPLLLGVYAFRKDRGRWAIPLAVLAAVVCFFLVRPFNFYGGTGALANRYFLPLYPALWFLAARPARWWPPAVAALAAAPFLLPLWLHPTAFPVGEDGRYRHVSALARERLPYETSQSHVPGGQDVSAHGLWVKMLNHNVWRPATGEPGGEGRLRLLGGGARGELLIGSPEPLSAVVLELEAKAPSRVTVDGVELRPTLLRPDGSMGFEVPLGSPRAVHPMWWTWDDVHLYELDLSIPTAPVGPLSFEVRPGGVADSAR